MALNFSQFGQVIDEPDNGYAQISNLLNSQANVSSLVGEQAAARADPFQKYKPDVAKSLSELLSNPGEVTTSPYYQFARDQGIEAVTRANKGVNSGKYLTDLQKFGTGLAGQQFGSLASLYNNILGGSAVGGAQMLMGGFGRGQDQQAMAAAGRAAGAHRGGSARQPLDIGAMLNRYGMGNQGGQGQYNGSTILSSFTGPGSGSYGMPSGSSMPNYGGYGGAGQGYWSSSDGGYGSFGGDYTASPYDSSYSYSDPYAYGDFTDSGTYDDYGYEW